MRKSQRKRQKARTIFHFETGRLSSNRPFPPTESCPGASHVDEDSSMWNMLLVLDEYIRYFQYNHKMG